MQNMSTLIVLVADELVALLRQFRDRSILDQEAALQLLRPIEEAARSARTPQQAHDAFVNVVRDTYVPAVLRVQSDMQVDATRVLDGIAQTLRTGRVFMDRVTGELKFVAGPSVRSSLADFVGALVAEVSAARNGPEVPLGFAIR